ncbi:MAG: FGGY family carbohydrate kinase [Parvibaculaceae bacterium]
MTRDIIIGIDAGTSVIKSVAFSSAGKQLAVTAIPNRYTTLDNGGVEQDMARTWRDAAQTLRDLADKIDNLEARVIAVAVTGQGDGMWLVDKEGKPVAPAWLWLDSRAASIAEEFTLSPSYAAHYERTGTGVNACQQNVQLAWLGRHAPEALARAQSAHHCKDWLYFKLTGARASDPSEANFTFGNYRSRNYAPDILDALGVSEAKRLLPEIVDGTERSHGLSADAAAATGLAAGTPVVLGYVDVVCTGLGGGLLDRQGRVGCSIAGSTGMHMRLAPSAAAVRLNPERTGYTMAFPAPGMLAQMQSNMASTLNIDWLLDVGRDALESQGVERSRKDLLEGLDDRILQRPGGRLLYHPYISQAGERGPFLDAAARAQFTGLEAGMGYADLMRAVFEGLSFAARDCYAAMGPLPGDIRLTGGGARSKALRLIFASALNAPVRSVVREEAGAAGAAMIAAVQQKVFPSMADCAAQWVDPMLGPETRPDADLVKLFDTTFPIYRKTRDAMRPVWRALQTARQGAHA